MKATVARVHPFHRNGAQLRRLRKRAEMSQERLAQVAGTTRRHLIRLENGEHLPSVELRNRLAEAVDCDREELQAFDEDDEEAAAVTPLSRDELRRAGELLGDLFSRLGATLPADDRDEVSA